MADSYDETLSSGTIHHPEGVTVEGTAQVGPGKRIAKYSIKVSSAQGATAASSEVTISGGLATGPDFWSALAEGRPLRIGARRGASPPATTDLVHLESADGAVQITVGRARYSYPAAPLRPVFQWMAKIAGKFMDSDKIEAARLELEALRLEAEKGRLSAENRQIGFAIKCYDVLGAEPELRRRLAEGDADTAAYAALWAQITSSLRELTSEWR